MPTPSLPSPPYQTTDNLNSIYPLIMEPLKLTARHTPVLSLRPIAAAAPQSILPII